MRYILLLSLLLIGCEREEVDSEDVPLDSAVIVGWEEVDGSDYLRRGQ